MRGRRMKKVVVFSLACIFIIFSISCGSPNVSENSHEKQETIINKDIFDWKPQNDMKRSSYHTIDYVNQGIGGDGKDFYFTVYASEAEEPRIFWYNSETEKIQDMELKTSLSPKLWKGKLYYLAGSEKESVLCNYDLKSKRTENMKISDLWVFRWEIYDGALYYIDIPNEEDRERGNLHMFDLKTQEDKVLAKEIDSGFLDFDNAGNVYYSRNSELMKYWQGETQMMRKIQGWPMQLSGEYLLTNDGNDYFFQPADKGERQKLQIEQGKDITSAFLNGNYGFYVVCDADAGKLEEGDLPVLYALDLRSKANYELGIVPDTELCFAGDRLFSVNTVTENISIIDIQKGKATYKEIIMNDPYPYVS